MDLFLLTILMQQLLLAVSVYLPMMGGKLSLASPAFFALGGSFAAWLSSASPWQLGAAPLGLGFLLAEIALASLAAIVLALLLARLTLRLRGIYLCLATLALVESTRFLLLNAEWAGGAIGLFGVPPLGEESWEINLCFLFLSLFCLGLAHALDQSNLGAALRAIRADEKAAMAMGIQAERCGRLVFCASAVIASMTGVLSAHLLGTWNARQGTFELGIALLSFVVFGGSARVWGAAAGALGLALLPELLRPLADFRLLVNGAVIVLACLFLPKGLVPFRSAWLQKFLRRELKPEKPLRKESSLQPGEPLLVAEGLSLHFGGVKALEQVSFVLHKGEILGIMGPNGAGKSTLINVLSGFNQAQKGTLRLKNRSLDGLAVPARARLGILRSFQNLRLLWDQDCLSNVCLGIQEKTSRKKREALAFFWLEQLGLGEQAETLAKHLSYGDARRLELARALAAGPEVLLLDEPVAGMNQKEKQEMAALLRQLVRDWGLSLIIIEHHVPLMMELCDRISFLHFGECLASGKPEEMRKNSIVREAYLGTRARDMVYGV